MWKTSGEAEKLREKVLEAAVQLFPRFIHGRRRSSVNIHTLVSAAYKLVLLNRDPESVDIKYLVSLNVNVPKTLRNSQFYRRVANTIIDIYGGIYVLRLENYPRLRLVSDGLVGVVATA